MISQPLSAGDRSIRVQRLAGGGRYGTAQVVRPDTAVRVLGPDALNLVLDPGTLAGP
jgi:hypothetical protein